MPQVLLHKPFLKMKVWWRWGGYELSPADLFPIGHLLKGIAICPEKDGTPFQKLPIILPLNDVRADWGFFHLTASALERLLRLFPIASTHGKSMQHLLCFMLVPIMVIFSSIAS